MRVPETEHNECVRYLEKIEEMEKVEKELLGKIEERLDGMDSVVQELITSIKV